MERNLTYISEFTSNIVHIPGSENVVADGLSCPSSPVYVLSSALPVFSTTPLNLSASGFDFSSLPSLQSACPSLQSMVFNPSLSIVSVPFLQSSVLCDVSSGSPQPLVPASLCHQLFISLQRSLRFLVSRFPLEDFHMYIWIWWGHCLPARGSVIS